MNSYGDGNNYRGTSCKGSEVTTYKMPLFENQEVEQLKQRIRELESKYNELLMAVQKKHPEETRHQTALRYIQQREAACHGPCQALEPPR